VNLKIWESQYEKKIQFQAFVINNLISSIMKKVKRSGQRELFLTIVFSVAFTEQISFFAKQIPFS
jgi:predicted Kef-type K+ transport protein